MHRNIFIFLLCVWCGIASGFAASTQYASFMHYTVADGLASNRALSVTVDNRGFLWVSTELGLDRFDGKTFKHFNSVNRPEMYRYDYISIRNWTDNSIMLGGYNGVLQEYDYVNDKFVDKMPDYFRHSFYHTIYSFYNDHSHEPYVLCSDGGFYPYDKKNKNFHVDFPAFKSVERLVVRSLFVDSQDRYWIGTVDTLIVMSKNGDRLLTFASPKHAAGLIDDIALVGNKVVVSTSIDELWIFDVDNINASPYVVNIPFDNIISTHVNKNGRIWFASDGHGLWYSDDITTSSPHFVSLVPVNSYDMEMKKIYDLVEDDNGVLWIASQSSGLWGLPTSYDKSFFFSSQIGFNPGSCSGFVEDRNNIFVSFDGLGLFSFNKKTFQIDKINLPNNNVLSISKGNGSSKIDISTWGGGLIHYDLNNGRVVSESFDGLNSSTLNFFSSAVLDNGQMAACSAGDGLYLKYGNSWRRIVLVDSTCGSSNLWIHKIVDGKNGDKWLLTTNNLWLMKKDCDIPLMPDSLFSKSHQPLVFYDAVCSDDGFLYVASCQGVLVASTDDLSVSLLDSSFNSNCKSIVRDNNGVFWVASLDGIFHFKQGGQLQRYPVRYSDKERFSFYSRSAYVDSEGYVYFGSSSGFFCIDSKADIVLDSLSYIGFSDFCINRKRIETGSPVFSKGMLSSGPVVLDYNSTNFSVNVDLVDYDENNPAKLRYRIEGLSNEWIDMDDNDRVVSINFLPYGNFSLVVEAFRPNSGIAPVHASLQIQVLPPWWATLWFKMLLVVLFLILIYLFFRAKLQSLKKARQELADKVDAQTKELRLMLADKNRILSVVAHDFKGPLYGIASAFDNWLDKYASTINENQRKPLSDISSSISHLQTEMQKLLDWAKAGQQEVSWKLEDVNASSIISDVVVLLKRNAENKNISLNYSVDIDRFVRADARSLEIILRNLIINSIKFTNDGGRVDVICTEENGMAKFVIKDNGVGISEEKLHSLMNSGVHESTVGTGNEVGTGLGIDLCLNYVSRNGGKLIIDSVQGQGTSCSFCLELSSEHVKQEIVTDIVPRKLDIDLDLLSGNSILVVDDDDLIRSSLADRLSAYFEVFSAKNGLEAIEIVKQKNPDIVLTDVSMPICNGIELAKSIVSDKSLAHIPILFISANNEEDDRLLGLMTGAVDYISKPFSIDELLVKVTNILRLRLSIQRYHLSKIMSSDGVGEHVDLPKSSDDSPKVIEPINPVLERFMKLLEDNFANCELQIDELASQMCMSQSTLGRRIKALTGSTPVELLNKFRLDKSYQMLSETDMSVSDVAYSVGYSESSYFSRKFKEQYGFPPSQLVQNR